MFDDRDSRLPASAADEHRLSDARGRVHTHVEEHGPLAVADLQGDLYAHEPRRFRRDLAVLGREGIIEVGGGVVRAGVDPARLGETETVPRRGGRLTLGPARGSDYWDLLELVRSVADGRGHAALASLARDLVSEGRIHRWDGEVGRVVFVATVEEGVRGWAHLSPGAGGDVAELAGGVAERFRDEGIGSRLLRYAVDSPLTREHCRVYQHIPAGDDDAFQFLRTHGWHVEACGRDCDELRVVQEV